MARPILFVSFWTMRTLLRILNAAVAVVLSLVCFVTGQTRRSEESASGIAAGLPKGSADTLITPLYGIEPLYGPIAEYGMPHADYTFRGTVASTADSSEISGAKVYLYAEGGIAAVDSATTGKDGAYSVGAVGAFPNPAWRIEVKDIDGEDNGVYFDRDTTVNVPGDSLKGGSGWYEGAAVMDVDIYLKPDQKTAAQGAAPRFEPDRSPQPLRISRTAGNIRVGTAGLPDGANVSGIIVDASGRAVWRFSGTSNTEFAFSSRGLAAGLYTAIARCGKTRLVSRMELR